MEAVVHQQCAYCGAESNGARYCCAGCENLDGKVESTIAASESLYLDLANIKNQFKLVRGPFDYQLHVEGLHCASCVHLLEKIPEFDHSVLEARVDYSRSSLAIRVKENFSLAKLVDLLKSWGYPAHFIALDEDSQEKINKENRALLKKLAVTGACAGNIMLFVIPVYSGLDGVWKIVFNWMSFFIFLPIIFYSGTQFYQGAWNSLRYKTVNVDLPITIALLSGFILSTINLFRGDGAIYYDSTAGFIFLILCARYYLKKTQQKFLSRNSLINSFSTEQYTLLDGKNEKIVTAQEIEIGHRLILKKGQICPVDGTLATASLIDLAVMNGEPLPRRFEKGMKILAGSKSLSEDTQVNVTANLKSSYLSSLVNELNAGEISKSNFTSLTDRAAQWLIILVSTIALVYFAFHFEADFQEAFNRSLALIVLACPCALAFGAPLTLNLALRKAQSMGILIKESGTIEKIWKIKKVFFDKTGTLTTLNLKVHHTEPENLSSELKSIILGLEKNSYHPIAFAIREFWSHEESKNLLDVKDILGVGVTGYLGKVSYKLVQNKEDESSSQLSVTLFENELAVGKIFFDSPLVPKTQESIFRLKKRGIEPFLISGDLLSRTQSVGLFCGLPKDNIFGGLSPLEKKTLISSHPNSIMIGDGSNDALALQAASVGIAVKGSTFVNLKAADVYFTREGLDSITNLLKLAQQTKSILFRNLAFALIYNLIGGALALLGYVDPWLAAILMPASSLLIVSSTLWGFR